jgi:hypothetical protein
MRFPAARPVIRLAAALAMSAVFLPAGTSGNEAKLWPSGPYVFSDETGGYRITGVSGKGTRADPIVITEEFFSATPVTLTIRARQPIALYDGSGNFANGILYMRIDALNNSELPWVEFEFELQEVPNRPSTFTDGLSFDQRSESPEAIKSSRFARFSRDFEPYDRLLFRDGKVDPGKTAGFGFLITDYTPRLTFYLVQDPRIPSS